MSELSDMDETLQQILIAATDKEVGLADVPSERPDLPYVILLPHSSPAAIGDFNDVTANQDWRYNLRMVGVDPWQVRWLQGKCREAMKGASVALGAQWVLPEGTGAIVPDGADMYSTTDTFSVRM